MRPSFITSASIDAKNIYKKPCIHVLLLLYTGNGNINNQRVAQGHTSAGHDAIRIEKTRDEECCNNNNNNNNRFIYSCAAECFWRRAELLYRREWKRVSCQTKNQIPRASIPRHNLYAILSHIYLNFPPILTHPFQHF